MHLVHIGATQHIRLNDPYLAAMWAVVTITITSFHHSQQEFVVLHMSVLSLSVYSLELYRHSITRCSERSIIESVRFIAHLPPHTATL